MSVRSADVGHWAMGKRVALIRLGIGFMCPIGRASLFCAQHLESGRACERALGAAVAAEGGRAVKKTVYVCDRPGCGQEFTGEPFRRKCHVPLATGGWDEIGLDLCMSCECELRETRFAGDMKFMNRFVAWSGGEANR
jgi:hypothetical protein